MLEEYGHRAELAAERYLNHLLQRLKNAADWESVNRLAGPFLGPESFYAGAVLGVAESLTGDVLKLLGLGKMLILAGIYDRIHSKIPLSLTAMDPITLALALAVKYNPTLAAEAKAAHEQLEEIWKELKQIVAHPIVFVETVGRKIWNESVDDWKHYAEYTRDNTVTSQFKAGRIAGHVLYQVVMTILLVLTVAGAAAKIAAKFPALLRWARIIDSGGSLEELQGLKKLGEGGGGRKVLSEEPPPKPKQPPKPKVAEEEEPPKVPPRNPAKLADGFADRARPAEVRTAQRVADQYSQFDGRVFDSPPPPDPGYDWADNLGNKFDAMGDGTTSKYFKLDQFTDSIDHHLLKGNDFTVIDMTGYTPEQIQGVTNYVNSLPASSQASILRVGF